VGAGRRRRNRNSEHGDGTLRILDRLFEKLPWIALPEQLPANGYWLVNGQPLAGFGFESSVLLIGAGMITGLRVSLSMLVGSLLLYAVVGPYLIGLDAAQAGAAGYIVSIPLGGAGYNLARWALWGGTSLMVFSSLAAFALQWRTIARSFRSFRKKVPTGDTSLDETMARIEVPMSWLVAGMVPISIGLLVLNVVRLPCERLARAGVDRHVVRADVGRLPRDRRDGTPRRSARWAR
jgi:hypothetical protein